MVKADGPGADIKRREPIAITETAAGYTRYWLSLPLFPETPALDSSHLQRIGEIRDRIGAIQSRFGGRADEGFARVMAQASPGAKLAMGGAAKPEAAAPAPVAASPVAIDASLAGVGGGIGRIAGPYGSAIAQSAARHGVDADLVKAVMTAESGGNPAARSPVGAIGLMQLMPGTAKSLGVDPRDPAQNIEGGAKYLGELTRRYGLTQGVAAYNAGPGAVEKHGGVPPYKETQAYVKRVLSLYEESKKR
jgi:soluble lytic murein transglycosylase-like protein